MGETLTVGVVARRVGLRPSAIRFYERKGLVASGRLANGYRAYGPEAISALRFISRAKALGFSLDAYEVAATELERQHAINWLTIFVPRLSLGLILAFVVYGLFRTAGSVLVRLHRVALSAQPTWRFITSNPSAR